MCLSVQGLHGVLKLQQCCTLGCDELSHVRTILCMEVECKLQVLFQRGVHAVRMVKQEGLSYMLRRAQIPCQQLWQCSARHVSFVLFSE